MDSGPSEGRVDSVLCCDSLMTVRGTLVFPAIVLCH